MFAIRDDFVSQHLPDRVVDAQRCHLAVVDAAGTIVAVNRAWMRFAIDNGVAPPQRVGPGANYIEVCRKAASHSRAAERALRGIKAVLGQERDAFSMVYACPAYGRRAWYKMEVTPLHDHQPMVVIQHADLTRRKAVEHRLLRRLNRLARQMIDIEEAERNRLSSQLHDHLQQLLVAARMALSSRTVQQVDDPASAQVRQAVDYLEEAVRATRSLSVELRPLTLERAGLIEALAELAQQHEQLYGIEVDFRVSSGFPKLPYPMASFIYHAAREMLFNAVKHAEPSHQIISLTHEDGRIFVAVSDDGRGMDPAAVDRHADEGGGTGLATIRQRLDYFGGRMDIDTAPQQGTTVWLTLPTPAAGMA